MRHGLMLAACLGGAMFASAAVAAGPVKVTVDGASRAAPVTKYEYGMFIEPIGGLVARTLWAEMLDDRKFYYPVVPAALERGLIVNRTAERVVRMLPPYVITEVEIAEALSRLDAALTAVQGA